MKNKETFFYSLKCTLPVMAGYMVLGIGFGMLLQSYGYGVLWALGCSLFIYAGSMQYVLVSLLSSGASILTAFLMTLLINLRHLFYGISMLSKYKEAGKFKPYLIFSLTDETFSLLCNPNIPEDINENDYYFYVSLFDHIWWVLGSLIGSVLGSVINVPTTGIEFSMTALFIVMFVEQWEKAKSHEPAIIGLGVSLLCLTIFGSESFLIPSMIGIALLLLLRKENIHV